MDNKEKNKKLMIIIIILIVIILLSFLFFLFKSKSNNTNVVDVNEPTLKAVNISIGEPFEIDSNTSSKNLTFVSSNADIVSINNGILTGVSSGTATVFVYDNDKVILKYEVTVYGNEEPLIIQPESISLDQVDITIIVLETKTIGAIILPNEVEDKTITWTSSDDSIVSVSNGQITGNKPGKATITATAINGITATANINVIEASTKVIEVSKVSISALNTSVKVGDTITINAELLPNDATDKTITWTSSDSSIAVVSNGIVTGINPGTVTISANSSNGIKDSITITIKPLEPSSITLDKDEVNLKVGEQTTLKATILPSNSNYKMVTWSSSDSSVASVDNGVVFAKKAGHAIITAKTQNNLSISCTVIVNEVPVSSVSLNKTSDIINVGEPYQLAATVSPSNATNKMITWTSSDTSVATVSESGLVTAIKDGTATITATSNNGISATFTATVKTPVTGISLNYSNVYMLQENPKESEVTYKRPLVATITPSNATNKEVTWTSSNTSVATVSDSGVVLAKSEGTTTITAITKDGNKTATAIVKVVSNELTNIYEVSPTLLCAVTRDLNNGVRAMQGVTFYKSGSTTYALYAGFQADDMPTVMTLVNLDTCSVVTKNNEQVFGHANDITYQGGKFYVANSNKAHGLTINNNETIVLDSNPINMKFSVTGFEYDSVNKRFYSKAGNYLYTFPSLTTPKSNNKWIGIVPNYYSNIENGQTQIVNQGIAYSNGNIYIPRTISNSSSAYYNHSYILVYDANTGTYKYTMHFSGDFLCHLEGMTIIGDAMYLGMNCHQASPKNQTFLIYNGLSNIEQRYKNS